MKVFSPVTFNPRDVPAIHTQVVQTNSHPLKPWLKKKILAKCINFVFAWTNLPWGKPFHNNSIFPKRKRKVQRSKTKPISTHSSQRMLDTSSSPWSTHVVPGPQRRHLPSGMRSPSFYLLELFWPQGLPFFLLLFPPPPTISLMTSK